MLKFSDGMSFDTQGKPRISSQSDGLYVVGNGMLIPINSREEGQQIIEQMNKEKSQ